MIFNNFHKGEYSSPYITDGFYSLTNSDIHTLGTLRGQLELTLDSSTPNESSILVSVPDGRVYAVSKTSGKIWQRTTGGVWTLVHTNTNGANVGAGYYNNRLWYFTSTKLGYYDFSTWSDSFGTFDNTTSTRPFIKGGVNRAFAYIGDGAQLARLDKDNIFSSNVLELPLGETTTDIVEWGNNLALTTIGDKTKIYQWNQSGDTYYKPDLIAYKDVDILVQSQNSNITYAVCRDKDNYVKFMYYTGQELDKIKQRSILDTTDANSYMKTEFDGRVYFAIGKKIYTIQDSALVCEFTATSDIQSLATDGDNLFVSATGVYKNGTNRADAVIQTPIVEGKAKIAMVYYDTLPTGASITGRVKINGGSWTDVTLVNEVENMRYILRGGLPAKNTDFMQLELTLVHNGTDTPIIRSIEIV